MHGIRTVRVRSRIGSGRVRGGGGVGAQGLRKGGGGGTMMTCYQHWSIVCHVVKGTGGPAWGWDNAWECFVLFFPEENKMNPSQDSREKAPPPPPRGRGYIRL